MIELHREADVLVQRARQLLMKRLLLLQAGNEDFKEFFQRRHRQVLPTVIVYSHLLNLAILLDELALLGF